MTVDLQDCLVVGISSRALFDLRREDALFVAAGLDAYRAEQLGREDEVLPPGTGFPLARAVLALNSPDAPRRAEVVVMSRNSTETSLRIFNSIRHYDLDITRAALSGGAPLAPYLRAFRVDLFLSCYEDDVRRALDAGVAAALLYDRPENPLEAADEIRIAFDGDAILFSDESERIFQADGLEAFARHEQSRAREPLAEGPFARLLHKLSALQQAAARDGITSIRTALVTARGGPAHERVIRTLLAWGIVVDEAFFLGGVPKTEILEAFRPHIFFDDQAAHCERAAARIPTGRVPVGTPKSGEVD